jgi:hypothetical protein
MGRTEVSHQHHTGAAVDGQNRRWAATARWSLATLHHDAMLDQSVYPLRDSGPCKAGKRGQLRSRTSFLAADVLEECASAVHGHGLSVGALCRVIQGKQEVFVVSRTEVWQYVGISPDPPMRPAVGEAGRRRS